MAGVLQILPKDVFGSLTGDYIIFSENRTIRNNETEPFRNVIVCLYCVGFYLFCLISFQSSTKYDKIVTLKDKYILKIKHLLHLTHQM